MIERELIMQEFQDRFASVSGMVYVTRNPKDAPAPADLPMLQMFEMTDTVVELVTRRNGKPVYKRALIVIAEMFISATTEGTSTGELSTFVNSVKKVLYADGHTLGGLCEFRETEMSRILRPPVGELVTGVGIVFEVWYIEDTSKL